MQEPSVPPAAEKVLPLSAAIYGLLFAAALLYLAPFKLPPDFWLHLQFGRSCLFGTGFITTNSYSYTCPEHAWANGQWLSAVIMAFVCQFTSWLYLHLVAELLVAGLLAMLLGHLYRNRVPCAIAAASIALLLVLAPQNDFSQVTPRLFSLFLFACELWLLLAWQETARRITILVLPFLFLLWINLDDAAAVGLLVLCAWLAAKVAISAVMRQSQNPNLFFAGVVVASAAACCITPYGNQLLRQALGALLNPPPSGDWHPLHAASTLGLSYMILIFSFAFLVYQKAFAGRKVEMVVAILCLMLPFLALRFLPFSSIAFILLCAGSIPVCLEKSPWLTKWLPADVVTSREKTWFAITIWFFSAFCLIMALERAPRLYDGLPEKAVSLLQKSGIAGNLACYANWGDYCIAYLPQMRVCVDSRWDLAYDKRTLAQYGRFMSGIEPWDELIRAHPTSAVLISPISTNFELMKLEPGWVLVYEDKEAAIFLPFNAKEVGFFKTLPSAQPHSVRVFTK